MNEGRSEVELRAVVALAFVMLLVTGCADAPEPALLTPEATVSSPTQSPVPVPTASPTPEPTATATPIPPTSTPVPTPVFTPPPMILPTVEVPLETATPTGAAPIDLNRKLDAIGFKTSLLRDLSASGPVERRLVTRDEIEAILTEEINDDADDLAIDRRLYSRLAIIEPSVDLAGLLVSVNTDLVLGLFMLDERILYVVADEDDFSLQDELTVAHEFTHGLQQLHFNIGELQDNVESNADRLRALNALIEGDATLTDFLYRMSYYDGEQQRALEEESADVDFSAFRAAPVFIQRTMVFPYVEGPQFVVSLFLQREDFSVVDQAYAAPPASTEQIIHHEKYGVEEPVDVEMPGLASALGEGWTELERNVMGELFLRSLLEGEVDRDSATQASGGWGGDSYLLMEDPDGGDVLASVSIWDTAEDASEFAAALQAYFAAVTGEEFSEIEGGPPRASRVAGDGIAVDVYVNDLEVMLIVADSVDGLEAVARSLAESEVDIVYPVATPTPTASGGS